MSAWTVAASLTFASLARIAPGARDSQWDLATELDVESSGGTTSPPATSSDDQASSDDPEFWDPLLSKEEDLLAVRKKQLEGVVLRRRSNAGPEDSGIDHRKRVRSGGIIMYNDDTQDLSQGDPDSMTEEDKKRYHEAIARLARQTGFQQVERRGMLRNSQDLDDSEQSGGWNPIVRGGLSSRSSARKRENRLTGGVWDNIFHKSPRDLTKLFSGKLNDKEFDNHWDTLSCYQWSTGVEVDKKDPNSQDDDAGGRWGCMSSMIREAVNAVISYKPGMRQEELSSSAKRSSRSSRVGDEDGRPVSPEGAGGLSKKDSKRRSLDFIKWRKRSTFDTEKTSPVSPLSSVDLHKQQMETHRDVRTEFQKQLTKTKKSPQHKQGQGGPMKATHSLSMVRPTSPDTGQRFPHTVERPPKSESLLEHQAYDTFASGGPGGRQETPTETELSFAWDPDVCSFAASKLSKKGKCQVTIYAPGEFQRLMGEKAQPVGVGDMRERLRQAIDSGPVFSYNPGAGKSGSTFARTWNDAFKIKMGLKEGMLMDELNNLKKLLKGDPSNGVQGLGEYLEENPDSLLNRFYAVIRVQLDQVNTLVLVMSDAGYGLAQKKKRIEAMEEKVPEVNRRVLEMKAYDLKGKSRDQKKESAPSAGTKINGDWDRAEFGRMQLEPEQCGKFVEVVRRDATFLKSFNFIDYSLFVVVAKVASPIRQEEFAITVETDQDKVLGWRTSLGIEVKLEDGALRVIEVVPGGAVEASNAESDFKAMVGDVVLAVDESRGDIQDFSKLPSAGNKTVALTLKHQETLGCDGTPGEPFCFEGAGRKIYTISIIDYLNGLNLMKRIESVTHLVKAEAGLDTDSLKIQGKFKNYDSKIIRFAECVCTQDDVCLDDYENILLPEPSDGARPDLEEGYSEGDKPRLHY